MRAWVTPFTRRFLGKGCVDDISGQWMQAPPEFMNALIHFAWYNAELEHHDIDPDGVDCFENIS
jgi:hypothetical protein